MEGVALAPFDLAVDDIDVAALPRILAQGGAVHEGTLAGHRHDSLISRRASASSFARSSPSSSWASLEIYNFIWPFSAAARAINGRASKTCTAGGASSATIGGRASWAEGGR